MFAYSKRYNSNFQILISECVYRGFIEAFNSFMSKIVIELLRIIKASSGLGNNLGRGY